MSLYRFFASNTPLPEVNNEKIHFLSIQKAVSRGIDIPDALLNPDSQNQDNAKSILICEKEEDLYEIEIHPIDPNPFTGQYTQMPYVATLTGKVNDGNVNMLAQYVIMEATRSTSCITTHLTAPSAVLELWQVWEGESWEGKAIVVDHEDKVSPVLKDYLFEQRYDGAICLKFNITKGA